MKFLLMLLWALSTPILANTGVAVQIQARLAAEARAADATFQGFSVQRGEAFYRDRHGDWSCATCHTDHPAKGGRHAVTQKAILPLAPSANPERFTDPKKVEKWFKRNCNDVLNRPCTAREKGDFIAYILTVRP